MDPRRLLDSLNRPLRSLRLSVIDRCNLRCQYCMPENEYVWLPQHDLLRFEEISALVDAFLSLGVDRLRLTGGEPLLRRDLASLVQMLSSKRGLVDLALTTNGVLLVEQIDGLHAAGLRRITISLDTLRPDRFAALTRFQKLARVTEGIEAARRVFGRLKIDAVVIKGFNDDELADLIEYGKRVDGEVRFIEYMDVGGATHWSPAHVVSREEMLVRLERRYGRIELVARESSAPAERFVLPDGTLFGIISSTTRRFCRACDRSRLTTDGMWYLCLYATKGIDLRAAVRKGADMEELRQLITASWHTRDDRGAERRVAVSERRAFVPVTRLRQDPHLEMHTGGG